MSLTSIFFLSSPLKEKEKSTSRREPETGSKAYTFRTRDFAESIEAESTDWSDSARRPGTAVKGVAFVPFDGDRATRTRLEIVTEESAKAKWDPLVGMSACTKARPG